MIALASHGEMVLKRLIMRQSLIDVHTAAIAAEEVEHLTGLNPSTIRTWRQRGLIHPRALSVGPQGYHLADICQIVLLLAFKRAGGSLARLYSFSGSMAGHIYQNLLQLPEAWDIGDNWQIYINEKHPAAPEQYGIITDTDIRSVMALDHYFLRAHPDVATIIDFGSLAGQIITKLGRPVATLTVHDLLVRDGNSVLVYRATGKAVE